MPPAPAAERCSQNWPGVIAGLNETKTFIMSPRMALQSLEVVSNCARIRADKKIRPQAFQSIRFVQGMQSYTADLERKIEKLLPEDEDYFIQLSEKDFDLDDEGPLRTSRNTIPPLVSKTLRSRFVHCSRDRAGADSRHVPAVQRLAVGAGRTWQVRHGDDRFAGDWI